MARHRRSPLKLRLKQRTIYTILAVITTGFGGFLLLSLTKQGEILTKIYDTANLYISWGLLPLPLILFSISLSLARVKAKFAGFNVTVGFTLVWLSLLGLTRAGIIGQEIWINTETLISGVGAVILLAGGVIIGLVITFNTSLGDVIETTTDITKGTVKFIGLLLGGLKAKKTKPIFVQEKLPLKVKGGQAEDIKQPLLPPKVPLTPEGKKEKQTNQTVTDMGQLGTQIIANLPAEQTIWEYPPLSLLEDFPGQKADRGDLKKNASVIEKTLDSFGIAARVAEVNLGPAVTQYALEIALGTKVSKITALSNDLALALAAPTGQIRIEAPIPGRSLVGIEIPNRSLEFVTLKTMLSSPAMRNAKSRLTVALGLDVSGNPLVADLGKMPHVLIAGTTGSGKSVLINSFIASLLFRTTPKEVKLILVDPKRVELIGYNGIPHLLTPVIVDVDKILSSLKWALSEMDRRYKLFASSGVRNVDSYNELTGFQALPYITIFIDELADLMAYAPVEVEDAICRLAQMSRATGIHLVVSTQRPSVDVITGLIKANIPSRIAFNVSSMVDSRVIIDMPGAEKLLGRGDMLYIPPDQAKPTRVQGTYVSEKEIHKLVEFLKAKNFPLEYTEEVTTMPLVFKKPGGTVAEDGKDELFEEAVRIVCQYDRASASLLQRRLSIGYARAARILDQLEEAGIVGPGEGSKPRDVLVRNAEDYLSQRHDLSTGQTSPL
jgi:S-DNA-T family DNA segregation ATPase FtsK/SpoIIIE